MDELLSLLKTTEYISGERLCQALSMTRAAIWKRMEKLREEGYRIEGLGKKGYRLVPVPDSLLPGYIAAELTTRWAGRGDIFYAQEVSSTNTWLKEKAREGAARGSLAICEKQTQGKGRLQRQWDAVEGENLLQSLLLRPTLPIEQAPLCTLAAAAAIAQAIEDTVPGLQAGIKWPNDIVLNGKKCVGILSELSGDMDGIHFIVMGVGVNANQLTFGGELAEKATSLRIERDTLIGAQAATAPIDRRVLLVHYLRRMEQLMCALEKDGLPGILPEYQRRSVTLGARVRVIDAKGEFIGTAEAVDETGALIVKDEWAKPRRVLSGDVSVRGVMGYV